MTELTEFLVMQFVLIFAVDIGAAWADILRRRTDKKMLKAALHEGEDNG